MTSGSGANCKEAPLGAAVSELKSAVDDLEVEVAGKQDALTFDDSPTADSANPVKSGGVYAAISTEKSRAETAEALKVNKPTSSPNGTNGQLLRTNGDGTTTWVDQGAPTDEQVGNAVSNCLDAHPEATTTVEDGSLTEDKFADSLKLKTLNDYVTPEMFGAVGDGTTDDTEEVQDCLDHAFANGKTVYLPNSYKITDSLDVHDWCVIRGSKKKDGWNIIFSPSGIATSESPASLFVCNDATRTRYQHSFIDVNISKNNGFCICFGVTCPIDRGSIVRGCKIYQFNIVFGCFIGHVSYVVENKFESVMYAFHTKNLTDSYIMHNYISGYRPNAPYCFYGGSINHSEVSGNFFDFWFGIFLLAKNSKILNNTFDYCFMVIGYVDDFNQRYIKPAQIEENFSGSIIANNTFPNCANCHTNNSGFNSVKTSIAVSYNGEFKIKLLEKFFPCAIYIGKITYNESSDTVKPSHYYYTVGATISGNNFVDDGIIMFCTNADGITMESNIYGINPYTYYVETLPRICFNILNSTNPNSLHRKVNLDIMKMVQFQNAPSEFYNHSIFGRVYFDANFCQVYYANKPYTYLQLAGSGTTGFYDAIGNKLT